MTSKEQNLAYLRMYLKCRKVYPWIAGYASIAAATALQHIGGMAGSWRTDYSECTYSAPQLINGEFVDLSTVEKVRVFNENLQSLQSKV